MKRLIPWSAGARNIAVRLVAGALSIAAAACGSDAPSTGATIDVAFDSDGVGDRGADGDGAEGPVWYGEVEAIVGEHCSSCHVDGGIGPFPLIDYDDASDLAPLALAAMEAGIMPPWPPDPDCNRYADERLVPDDELALFRAWVEAGTPAGDPASGLPGPTPPAPLMPDIVASPVEPYTPSETLEDDYRCFLLDATFDEETYASALWVEPGQTTIVHHVLVYRIDAESVAEFEARTDAEPRPGFQCFGGAFGGPIGWYVPGTVPRAYDEGDAVVIPPGSRLLMQVHYHPDDNPPADLTTFNMITSETPPENTFETVGFANGAIRIEPGDAESTHVAVEENTTPYPLVVREVAGHMHLLGKQISLEVVRSDGSTECLLDIPDWDFEWQQFYTLREDVVVYPGDAVRMTCTYDNSARNQPFVDGEQREPRLVTWGEGTLDEMCLSYVSVVVPRDGVIGGVCPNYDVCVAGCDDPDSYLCLMECSIGVTACGDCIVETFFGDDGCVRTACGIQAAAVADCYTDCRVAVSTSGVDLLECMGESCPAGLDAVDACVTPRLAAGDCDAAIDECADF